MGANVFQNIYIHLGTKTKLLEGFQQDYLSVCSVNASSRLKPCFSALLLLGCPSHKFFWTNYERAELQH